MSWITAAIIGAIIGWVLSYGIEKERRRTWASIIVGAIGGIGGVWLFFGVFGLMTASVATNFWLGILWAVIGALILASIINAMLGSERRETMYAEKMERTYPYEYEGKEKKKKEKKKRKMDI